MQAITYGSKSFVVENAAAATMLLKASAALSEGDADTAKYLLSLSVKLENGQITPEEIESTEEHLALAA